jgi:hypothetical protein
MPLILAMAVLLSIALGACTPSGAGVNPYVSQTHAQRHVMDTGGTEPGK